MYNNNTFRAVFLPASGCLGTWPQTLQNKGKRKMTTLLPPLSCDPIRDPPKTRNLSDPLRPVILGPQILQNEGKTQNDKSASPPYLRPYQRSTKDQKPLRPSEACYLGTPKHCKTREKTQNDKSTRLYPHKLRGPAAILFISRDTCSDSIAKLFRACFYGVSHNYRAIRCRMRYRTDVPV